LKQVKEYLSDNDDFWKDMTEEIMYTVSYMAERRDELDRYEMEPMSVDETTVEETTPVPDDTLFEYNY
jgi:hypothetical protein